MFKTIKLMWQVAEYMEASDLFYHHEVMIHQLHPAIRRRIHLRIAGRMVDYVYHPRRFVDDYLMSTSQ